MDFFESQLISQFVADNFYWLFLGILVLNLTQRKHQKTAQKKRLATLYLAVAALVLYSAGQLVLNYEVGDIYLLLVLVIVVGVIMRFRDRVFPFTLRCVQSGKRLDMHSILYRDSNTLPEFDEPEPESEPEQDPQP